MRRRRLPPLNPVRSFEAAARHGSFTKAAEELHVTPVAISRQVAVLEGYFGIPLFDRLHQTLRLTQAGRDFLPCATAAFDLLSEGARKLQTRSSEPVVICAYPSVAIHWLIPRLSRFHDSHPDIEIRMTTAVAPKEFDYDEVDIGLQYLHDARQDLITQLLLPDIIQPACSPKLLGGPHPLPPAANLSHHIFLHSQHRQQDWQEWLQAAGLDDIKPARELTFTGSSLAYQAAAEGMGVAVVQRLLVDEEFRSGRLVAPFNLAAQRTKGICMVSRPERLDDPRVAAFRTWLEAEADVAIARLDLSNTINLGEEAVLEFS